MSNPLLSQSAFDKCAEIIRCLQKADWAGKEEYGDRLKLKEPLDVRKIAATPAEARLLSHIISMVLQESPAGLMAQADTPKHSDIDMRPLDYKITAKIESKNLEQFKKDDSLDQTFSSFRPITHKLKPKNLREALEFVRWKESGRWQASEDGDGFHYTQPHSHGRQRQAMFWDGEQRQNTNDHFLDVYQLTKANRAKNKHKDWAYKENYPLTQNVPQLWSNANHDIWVPQKYAKDILVDFLGLDAKILGIETQQRARR